MAVPASLAAMGCKEEVDEAEGKEAAGPGEACQGFRLRGGEVAALERLQEVVVARPAWVRRFDKPSSNPLQWAPGSTSMLSPYLKFGMLSCRTLHAALDAAVAGCDDATTPPQSLHGQLYWREFFYALQHATPNFCRAASNPLCLQVAWREPKRDAAAAADLQRWAEGRTGVPLVDAAMAQLRATGWLHHLLRHVVACFLTRGQLWVHWEAGVRRRLAPFHAIAPPSPPPPPQPTVTPPHRPPRSVTSSISCCSTRTPPSTPRIGCGSRPLASSTPTTASTRPRTLPGATIAAAATCATGCLLCGGCPTSSCTSLGRHRLKCSAPRAASSAATTPRRCATQRRPPRPTCAAWTRATPPRPTRGGASSRPRPRQRWRASAASTSSRQRACRSLRRHGSRRRSRRPSRSRQQQRPCRRAPRRSGTAPHRHRHRRREAVRGAAGAAGVRGAPDEQGQGDLLGFSTGCTRPITVQSNAIA